MSAPNMIAKRFCPACYFAIEGEAVDFGKGCFVHMDPSCLTLWGALNDKSRATRHADVIRLSNTRLWAPGPSTCGKYWAKLRGGNVLRNVEVFERAGRVLVNYGPGLVDLVSMTDYEFLAKAA